ncbi:oligosaccharide flippase family protein [Flavobacterium sp. UBA4197]|uniref:oligosaccharide flippase family protein n=1 Tax=Flavobacterium sp. UBA4197 TaxID=1946546 RepID=UPI002579745E|nr:oligosaccharide flippase family protein [Flavobacterium sp. UBA4197]
MFAKLQIIKNNNKSIVRNFFHIGIIKFVNILSKYLLIGYLIRVLGEENYGTITWVDSFIQYFLILINFGFDLYISKNIVENKDDKAKIDEIISSIYTIKALLFLLSFILLVPFIFISGTQAYFFLFIVMMLMGGGEVLFPIWYFQGIEKMKPITIVTVIARVFLVIGTFVLVVNNDHGFRYVVLLVISNLIWGGMGFYFLKKESNFKFLKIPLKTLLFYLKEGYLFFLGKFSTLFLNFGTIFLIGYFCSKSLVSGFDLASKIVFAFVFVYEVIQQAVFPSIVRNKRITFMRKLVLLTFMMGIIFALITYCFSEKIMGVLGGNEMTKYSYLLKQMVILIPAIGISNIVGSCALVAFGSLKQYNFSLIISCLAYMSIVLFLYLFDQMYFENLIFLRIGVDILMACLILFFSIKNKILFSHKLPGQN